LVADFLLFARPASGNKEHMYLNGVIGDILKIFTHSPDCPPGIRVVTHFQDEVYMLGDPQQIKQVFWNLFINAAQAMPQGGELRVNIRKNSNLRALMGESVQGEISVSDTGSGIQEKDLDKIFDPFFTTKEKGTGLGLSIVHRIIEGYAGKITLRSEPGEGTTFTIFLPIQ